MGIAQSFPFACGISTVSRCIEKVSNALVEISDQFIYLPETAVERTQIKNE